MLQKVVMYCDMMHRYSCTLYRPIYICGIVMCDVRDMNIYRDINDANMI